MRRQCRAAPRPWKPWCETPAARTGFMSISRSRSKHARPSSPIRACERRPSPAACARGARLPRRRDDGRFSNRPVGVKHFQAIHRFSVNVAHGLVLLLKRGTQNLQLSTSCRPITPSIGGSRRAPALRAIHRGGALQKNSEIFCHPTNHPMALRCREPRRSVIVHTVPEFIWGMSE
jgi:hypothetical protein